MFMEIFSQNVSFFTFDTIIGWKLSPLLFMIGVELFQKQRLHGLEQLEKIIARPLRWGVYYILILMIIRYGGPQEQFIYFQF